MIVICNKEQREYLMQLILASAESQDILYFDDIPLKERSTVCIDLLFEENLDRINKLSKIAPLVIINNVIKTSTVLPPNFFRINAWPVFFDNAIIEASGIATLQKNEVEKVFALFQKKILWTKDTSGFISARTIAMIINEAYLLLQEGVSSKEQIDTAMKLGTNYPYGPFEWAAKVGVNNIFNLLNSLSKESNSYTPCDALKLEALK